MKILREFLSAFTDYGVKIRTPVQISKQPIDLTREIVYTLYIGIPAFLRPNAGCFLSIKFILLDLYLHAPVVKRKEPGMPYMLNVEQRGSYLYITVTGDNSYETVHSYLSEVRSKCLQYDCPDVLIVENLAGPSLDTMSIFDLVTRNSKQALQVVGRLAIVDINPEHRLEDMEFAENVAVNRGLTVKAFATIQSAEDWLGSPAEPQV